MADSRELIQRYCSRGDQAAFKRFYQDESPRLWRFLVARGCDADQAYDVVAEAFLKFITNICNNPTYPRAFLYRIALNFHIDTQRRAAVAAETSDPQALDALPGAANDPISVHAIRQAMAKLCPDEQNLLLMRYWIGLTHAELAHVAGLPEGTVRRQAADALHKLKAILDT